MNLPRRTLLLRESDTVLVFLSHSNITRVRPSERRTVPVISSEPSNLDALMARLASGDRAAFARVFELLWHPIHRLCVSLLRNEADAADAAQEAMQKIFERSSDYDKARPAMPWAMAIAAWECRTLLRKRTRRRESDDPVQDLASDHPEESMVLRDLTSAALDSLGELSGLDRETLIATFWDEAAQVSGATLRKRRERALERLRTTFRRVYGLD